MKCHTSKFFKVFWTNCHLVEIFLDFGMKCHLVKITKIFSLKRIYQNPSLYCVWSENTNFTLPMFNGRQFIQQCLPLFHPMELYFLNIFNLNFFLFLKLNLWNLNKNTENPLTSLDIGVSTSRLHWSRNGKKKILLLILDTGEPRFRISLMLCLHKNRARFCFSLFLLISLNRVYHKLGSFTTAV